VGSFKTGDPVFGALHPTAVFGTYSEYTVAESSELHSKPENLSHREAAAIPFAALTAWRAVRSIAGLRNG
jgi:NADPH:quinone reductase-like Zn-dependent oxidoreductase